MTHTRRKASIDLVVEFDKNVFTKPQTYPNDLDKLIEIRKALIAAVSEPKKLNNALKLMDKLKDKALKNQVNTILSSPIKSIRNELSKDILSEVGYSKANHPAQDSKVLLSDLNGRLHALYRVLSPKTQHFVNTIKNAYDQKDYDGTINMIDKYLDNRLKSNEPLQPVDMHLIAFKAAMVEFVETKQSEKIADQKAQQKATVEKGEKNHKPERKAKSAAHEQKSDRELDEQRRNAMWQSLHASPKKDGDMSHKGKAVKDVAHNVKGAVHKKIADAAKFFSKGGKNKSHKENTLRTNQHNSPKPK